MSLYTVESRFLAIGPRIEEKDGILHIFNANIVRLLTLFLHLRHVQIDFEKRFVQIDDRWFWFRTHTSLIPFETISHLDYDFSDLPTSFGFLMETNDSIEKFTITLVCESNDKYELCAFRGEGAATTGWKGVLLGDDDIHDFMGSQEDDSRLFATRLCEKIGVPLGKRYDFSEITRICESCGQQTSKNMAKCLYCGA